VGLGWWEEIDKDRRILGSLDLEGVRLSVSWAVHLDHGVDHDEGCRLDALVFDLLVLGMAQF